MSKHTSAYVPHLRTLLLMANFPSNYARALDVNSLIYLWKKYDFDAVTYELLDFDEWIKYL